MKDRDSDIKYFTLAMVVLGGLVFSLMTIGMAERATIITMSECNRYMGMTGVVLLPMAFILIMVWVYKIMK